MKVADTHFAFETADDMMMDNFEGMVEDMIKEDEFDEESDFDEPSTSMSHKKKRYKVKRHRHASNEEKEEKITCSYCLKSIIKSYLQKHITRMHSGQKNYTW